MKKEVIFDSARALRNTVPRLWIMGCYRVNAKKNVSPDDKRSKTTGLLNMVQLSYQREKTGHAIKNSSFLSW